MDPVMIVLIPGVVGGLILALIIFRIQAPPTGVDPLRNLPVTTDIINMARIRVDGIGGLGLVAMALTVAWFVRGFDSMSRSGWLWACFWRWCSSCRGAADRCRQRRTPGANTPLTLDAPPPPPDTRDLPPPACGV
jgi:hypothetical protein